MKKITFNSKQVRIFTLILLFIVFFLSFKLTETKGTTFRIILFAAETILFGFFMLKPRIFFPFFRIVLIITSYIGNFLFLILSTVVYYCILTVMALLMKLFRKKFMLHKPDKKLESYYEDSLPNAGMEKQF